MTIIEAVRAWLKTCPALEGERLNVDFLPTDAQSYSIEVVPCRETVKQYMDGSKIKRFLFVLASREVVSADITQNTSNLTFYEDFAGWVERQNRRPKHLPDLGEDRTIRKIEVNTSGYLDYTDDHEIARYQIQMELTYTQRGER